MSLINVSLNVVAYADEPKSANPKVKFADLSWSMLGLPTAIPRSVPMALNPGETQVIMMSNRAIDYDNMTSFDLTLVSGTSDARIAAAIDQRTARLDGDGTTEWALVRTGSVARLQYTGTGTAPTFGGMSVGDGVTLDSPFNIVNQGSYQVVGVGADYIEFINAVAQDETVVGQVEIYSSGPVQIGDVLDITSSQFSYPNQGKFKVTAVTDSYIQFSNPNAIPQTVTGVLSNEIVIYPEAHSWILVSVDHKVIVRLNGDTGNGIEVEPPVDGDLVNFPGLLLKRGKIFKVELYNPTLSVVNGQVLLTQ